MRASWLTGTVVPLAILAAVPAQTTWIVDSNNGPGAHFPTLIAAIASPLVVHGDVIHLRLGGYLGTTISKGVSIIAPAGASLGAGAGPASGVVISGLPAGTRCTLRGVTMPGLPYFNPLTISNCAGAVHLDRVTIPAPGILCQQPAMVCSNCASITVNDSSLTGLPAISATDSTIAVSGSNLSGAHARWSDTIFNGSATGVAAVRSHVTLAFTPASGGNGFELNSPIFGNHYWRGSPAIACQDGSLTVTGPAGTSLTAGTSPRLEAIPAIQLVTVATVAIDPRMRLLPSHNAPPIGGLPPYSPYRPVAGVRVLGGATSLAATVLGAPGAGVVLALGVPMPPVATSLGPVWLDLRLSWPAGTGVMVGDTSSFTVPIPNDPALFGVPVGFQALVSTPSNHEVTNPAVVVLG